MSCAPLTTWVFSSLCTCFVAGPREESDLHAALLAGPRRGAHLGELATFNCKQ